MHKIKHCEIISLAALFQCTILVQELAHSGMVDDKEFNCCINSLFISNAQPIDTIYSLATLEKGIKFSHQFFKGQIRLKKDLKVTHAIQLIMLEHKLNKNKPMHNLVHKGIEDIDRFNKYVKNAHEFQNNHECITKLATLYHETISTLLPKIIIYGEAQHLKNEAVSSKIRALLLAGIRSVHLWRHYGGKIWHLIFLRKRLSVNLNSVIQQNWKE